VRQSVAAFPLATPLLPGPGAISTGVILANPPFGPFVTFLVITFNALLTFVILIRIDLIRRILGVNSTMALARVTALLIAAIGISFVREGVADTVKTFFG
jgi:multiple antibiotic resistance protein